MSNEMTYEESEDFVISVLKEKGPLTTAEIEAHAAEHGKSCPDKTILVLTKLKAKDLIKGDFDLDQRTWIWQV